MGMQLVCLSLQLEIDHTVFSSGGAHSHASSLNVVIRARRGVSHKRILLRLQTLQRIVDVRILLQISSVG